MRLIDSERCWLHRVSELSDLIAESARRYSQRNRGYATCTFRARVTFTRLAGATNTEAAGYFGANKKKKERKKKSGKSVAG